MPCNSVSVDLPEVGFSAAAILWVTRFRWCSVVLKPDVAHLKQVRFIKWHCTAQMKIHYTFAASLLNNWILVGAFSIAWEVRNQERLELFDTTWVACWLLNTLQCVSHCGVLEVILAALWCHACRIKQPVYLLKMSYHLWILISEVYTRSVNFYINISNSGMCMDKWVMNILAEPWLHPNL